MKIIIWITPNHSSIFINADIDLKTQQINTNQANFEINLNFVMIIGSQIVSGRNRVEDSLVPLVFTRASFQFLTSPIAKYSNPSIVKKI